MDNEEKIKELEEKMLNYKRNYKQPKSISKNTLRKQVVRYIMKSIKKNKNKELEPIKKKQIINLLQSRLNYITNEHIYEEKKNCKRNWKKNRMTIIFRNK